MTYRSFDDMRWNEMMVWYRRQGVERGHSCILFTEARLSIAAHFLASFLRPVGDSRLSCAPLRGRARCERHRLGGEGVPGGAQAGP